MRLSLPQRKQPRKWGLSFLALVFAAPTTLGHGNLLQVKDRGLITSLETLLRPSDRLLEGALTLPTHPAPMSFSMCHFFPPCSMRSFRSSAALAASAGSILLFKRSFSNSRIGTSTKSKSSSRSMALTSNNLNASAV